MKAFAEARQETKTPEQVVMALVYHIRDQFYREEQKAAFYPHLKELKKVVTWPAHWFNEKALFIPAERYQAIMLEVFQGIKRNGDTGSVQYWPRYLLTCVQRHFRFNAEEYVDEGKAARDVTARLLRGLPAPRPDQEMAGSFIKTTAAAHRLLKSPGGKRADKSSADLQQKLF